MRREYEGIRVDDYGRDIDKTGTAAGTPLDGEALVAIGLISVVAFLVILLIFMYCCMNCWGGKQGPRRRLSVRSTDIRYIQQIQRLVERHKEVEKMRQAGMRIPKVEQDQPKLKVLTASNKPQQKIPEIRYPPRSRSASPGRPRSRTSSATSPQTLEKLAKLRRELEHYKIDHKIQVRKPYSPSPEGTHSSSGGRKRTWGGMADVDYDAADYVDIESGRTTASPSQFRRIPMPDTVDVGVQTLNILEREYPSNRRIFQTSFETTV